MVPRSGLRLALLIALAAALAGPKATHAADAAAAAAPDDAATTTATASPNKNDAYRAQPIRAQLERAVKAARALAALHPNAPDGHLQLAVALHRLNDLAPDGGTRVPEAEAAYRAALAAAAPSAAEAAFHVRGNLAVLLLGAGRIGDALSELDGALADADALGLAPDETAAAHFNRGKALGAAGRLRKADAAYVAAMRGAAGADLATFGKAAAAVAAAALPPELADAVVRVAAAGRAAMRGRPGLAFLDELEQQWPGNNDGDEPDDAAAASAAAAATAAANQKGQQQEAKNDDDGGNDGNGIDPATAAAVAAAATAAADPALEWLSAARPQDLAWLHFAAYKADERGRAAAARAWAHLRTGNMLMAASRGGGRYDARRERGALAVLTEAFRGPFDPPAGADAAADAELGRGAVFIVGAPRSGSTLIEQMFAAHPRAFAAGEDTRLAPVVAELQAALARPGADAGAELRRAGQRYLEQMRALVPAGAANATHIVDKMLMNIWRVGHALLMLPRACVVHAARHPLDAAASIYAQPFSADALPWAWDLGDIADQLELVWALADHWAAAAPHRFTTVHYEALVAAPRATIARALAACGLEYDPKVLAFHKARRARGVHTASQAQVTQPLYASSVGRWRRHARGLAPVRQRLAALIERYEAQAAAAVAAARAAEAGAEEEDQQQDARAPAAAAVAAAGRSKPRSVESGPAVKDEL